jgi:hypothetical protein
MTKVFSVSKENAASSDDPVLAWISDRLPDPVQWHKDAIVKSVEHDGKTIAAWAYCPGENGAWDLALATEPGTPWKTPECFAQMLGFPFEQLGASKLVTMIADNNHACIALTEKQGFTLEETIPNHWPNGRAGLLYVLRPGQGAE